jgi:hypothetical protein
MYIAANKRRKLQCVELVEINIRPKAKQGVIKWKSRGDLMVRSAFFMLFTEGYLQTPSTHYENNKIIKNTNI